MKKIRGDNSSGNELNPRLTAGYTPEFKLFKQNLNKRFYLLIIFLIVEILLFFAQFNNPEITPLYNFFSISFLLVFNVYLYVLIGIPLIWMLFIITRRTKSWIFGIQIIVYLQVALVIFIYQIITAAPDYFPIVRSILFAVLNIPLLGPILMYYPLLVIVELFYLRHPLFITGRENAHYFGKSTILSSQATKIDSTEDGYSQRPLFSEFNVLASGVQSVEEFQRLGTDYAKFLGKKGLIIYWEMTNAAIKLYPRFLTWWPTLFFKPLGMIYFLNNVRKRKNLTVVEITYDPPQISIQVSPADYEILSKEVTFHLLGQNVLKKIKESLLAFLNDDRDVAINILCVNT